MIEVIDNFLSKEDFVRLQRMFVDVQFPWYYNKSVVYGSEWEFYNDGYNDGIDVRPEEKYNYQFVHTFYSNKEHLPYKGREIKSSFLSEMDVITKKLNAKKIFKLKANMNPNTDKNFRYNLHIDTSNVCNTSIFYINSNDGWTEFENGDKVESVENRIVIFDSQTKHTGTTCTNAKVRVLINLNYE